MSDDKPLQGMKVLLSVPTYGPVDSQCARDLRVAIMAAASKGVEWVGDSSTDHYPFALARNSPTQHLYDNKGIADGIMWIDSDIRMKSGDIYALLDSVRAYKADFVTGVYHAKVGDYWPTLYDYDAKRHVYRQMANYPDNAFFQVDGSGFGFCWTSSSVIEKIAAHPKFDKKKLWFPDERDSGGFGEDLSFCYQARRAGVQLYCNTTVLLGHSGEPKVVYREDFIEKQKSSPNNVVFVKKESENAAN
jgi:hypothetical protein